MPSKPLVGPVILNNTPLVALWSVRHLRLLRDLYEEVLIPQAVYKEFLATEQPIRQAALVEAPWIKVTSIINPRQTLIYVGLNQGEAEVLTLATEQAARLVIIDERKGRRYAQRLDLPLTGTVGVLLAAKKQGLIPKLHPILEQLLNEGLFLTQEIIKKAIELAEE